MKSVVASRRATIGGTDRCRVRSYGWGNGTAPQDRGLTVFGDHSFPRRLDLRTQPLSNVCHRVRRNRIPCVRSHRCADPEAAPYGRPILSSGDHVKVDVLESLLLRKLSYVLLVAFRNVSKCMNKPRQNLRELGPLFRKSHRGAHVDAAWLPAQPSRVCPWDAHAPRSNGGPSRSEEQGSVGADRLSLRKHGT